VPDRQPKGKRMDVREKTMQAMREISADRNTSGHYIVTTLSGLVLLFHFTGLILMLSNHFKVSAPPAIDVLRSMIIMIQVPCLPFIAAASLYPLGMLVLKLRLMTHRELTTGERMLMRIHTVYAVFILILAALWSVIITLTPMPYK
jgi:cellulose synthase/poly-beta-1,6-N-acetylglucosamine synthase-like glycosyltransferase